MTWPAHHITMAIHRSPKDVYAFAADPRNLPRWAAGLAGGEVKRVGDHWIAEAPMGTVTVRFAPANDLGVMDHDVTLASGETFHNPFRVLANDEGSEVVFTLYHRPGMSASDLANDVRQIEKDLSTLKAHLEGLASE